MARDNLEELPKVGALKKRPAFRRFKKVLLEEYEKLDIKTESSNLSEGYFAKIKFIHSSIIGENLAPRGDQS